MKRACLLESTNKHEQMHASSIRPIKIKFIRMKRAIRKIPLAVIVLLFLLNACKNAPVVEPTVSLPRSIPEAEGVSSEDIITFLDSAAVTKHEFHSIMIVRHGKVVAEGWWAPYRSDLRHTMYSTSKSFTSTAIGFAVTENRLTVNDKVVSFFPEELPDTISPFLAALTVKDLLTMSVGQEPDPTFSRLTDTNWVRSFLALPIKYEPGTKFLYNSMATYMLSAIVQKVTGEKVIDYLTPRLFQPLVIEGMDWEVDPKGINTGGWGLRVKTEDMAKFGQLYLQKGMWNGKQIIHADWIEEATSFKIDQSPDSIPPEMEQNEWNHGYCYQFWRCRNNAYRADGAFGQYIFVIPDKDAVIAITSESPDMGSEMNLVWKFLYPALRDEKLPENAEMADRLKERLANLALPVPDKGAVTQLAQIISGLTFTMDANDWMMESLQFTFAGDSCILNAKSASTELVNVFGVGRWIKGETHMPGPSLLGSAKDMPPAKVVGACGWDGDTLKLALRYIESPHTQYLSCAFSKDRVLVSIKPSNNPNMNIPPLKGVLKK
jgi:CubicO group peptidase (beta-lactamase class C family)